MTDDIAKPDGLKSWESARITTRDWTVAEVAEAVAYLKKEMPAEWAELERLEIETGDLNGSRAVGRQLAKLQVLHPECKSNPFQWAQLASKVRDVRRRSLGLK